MRILFNVSLSHSTYAYEHVLIQYFLVLLFIMQHVKYWDGTHFYMP